MLDELFQRCQFQFLTGSVDAAERGTEGYHVQIREFLEEEAAFEPGVDCQHKRFNAKQFLVRIHGNFQDVGLEVRLPAGIFAVVFGIE